MARTREFDEDVVLAAITETFWTSGYAGTSVDDILRATGLTKGSIYNSFGGKWSLFSRAFDDYCTRSIAFVSDRLAGPESSAAMRLRALFDSEPTSSGGASSPHVAAEASLDQVPGPSNTNPPRACLIAKTTAELAATHPHVASRARETFQKLLVVLADTVGQAQRAGDVPSDVDPQEAAALLLTTLRGIEALTEVQMPNATLSDAAQLALRAIGLNSTHH